MGITSPLDSGKLNEVLSPDLYQIYKSTRSGYTLCTAVEDFAPGGGDKYFLRLGFEDGASTAYTDADISQAKHLHDIGWQFYKALK